MRKVKNLFSCEHLEDILIIKKGLLGGIILIWAVGHLYK